MSALALTAGGAPALVSLTARELTRFVRQPSRIVAAIGTPLLIWALFGSGFAGSFAYGAQGASYAAYLLPGMASMVVLFSSIFGAISLIEDRHAGFLQSVLVSPAPRWAIVGAKVAGGTILSVMQAVPILLLAPLLGAGAGLSGLGAALLGLVLMSIFINGLGLAAAWRIDSTQGFHGVMNLVLMPMWVLSGALFPVQGAAGWLRAVMLANPLMWPAAAVRHALGAGESGAPVPIALVWAAAGLVAAAGFAMAWMTVGRPMARGAGPTSRRRD